jgi:hypothetical protein
MTCINVHEHNYMIGELCALYVPIGDSLVITHAKVKCYGG